MRRFGKELLTFPKFRPRRDFPSPSVNRTGNGSSSPIRIGNTRPAGALEQGDVSGSGATGLSLPKTASAAVNATLYPSPLLFWRGEKTLRPENDGFEPSSSASPISCG